MCGNCGKFLGLLANDTEYAVTWHRIDGGAVKGDRVIQRHVLIAPTDTAFTLKLKCYQAGVEGFRDLLNALAGGEELSAYPQALVRRSEFPEHRRPDAAGCLRWDRSAQDLSAITRALDFGPYHFNPLCLSKAVVGDDVVAIRCLEVSSSRSSLSAGTVLEIHAGHWRVATGTEDVDVWFVGSDGRPVDARALARHSGVDIGDRLPILSDAEARSITVAHELLAPREEFWRRRLEQFKIVQLPFSSLLAGKTPATWQSTSWLTAGALGELSPSDRTEYLLTAWLIYLARITGESELQLGWSAAPNGLRAGGRAVEVLLASAVPMVIAIDLSDGFAQVRRAVAAECVQLRENNSFAWDLIARCPTLRDAEVLRSRRPWPVGVTVTGVSCSAAQNAASSLSSETARSGELLTLEICTLDGGFRWHFDSSRFAPKHIDCMT